MSHPGTQSSPESLQALKAGDKARLSAIVLAYVRQCRFRGATADETSQAFGLVHNSVAMRLTERENAGPVVKLFDGSGQRVRRQTPQGSPAGVYVAAELAQSIPESLLGDLLPDRSYWE